MADTLDLMPVESAMTYDVAPAIVLLIFGCGLAHTTAARDARLRFTAGICLVVGYGLFAALGGLLFRFSANGVVYRLLLPRATAIAGLTYPIAGGLGGATRGLQSRAVAALILPAVRLSRIPALRVPNIFTKVQPAVLL